MYRLFYLIVQESLTVTHHFLGRLILMISGSTIVSVILLITNSTATTFGGFLGGNLSYLVRKLLFVRRDIVA